MNRYFTSNGERVTESTIKKRLSTAYKLWYDMGPEYCRGCGIERAIETSHIISKARCKELHKTELIWTRENTYPSCRACHIAWESISNPEWCELMNVDECLEILEKFDKESFNKRMYVYENHISSKTNPGLHSKSKNVEKTFERS